MRYQFTCRTRLYHPRERRRKVGPARKRGTYFATTREKKRRSLLTHFKRTPPTSAAQCPARPKAIKNNSAHLWFTSQTLQSTGHSSISIAFYCFGIEALVGLPTASCLLAPHNWITTPHVRLLLARNRRHAARQSTAGQSTQASASVKSMRPSQASHFDVTAHSARQISSGENGAGCGAGWERPPQ